MMKIQRGGAFMGYMASPEDKSSINSDVEGNAQLKQMMEESKREYKQDKGMSTSKLLNSLSAKDFD